MKTLLLSGMAVLIIGNSCRDKATAPPAVPAIFINAATNRFVLQHGVMYLNGIPFSGHQYALYATGDTAFVTPFYNGRAYGISKQWYANKQLKELRHFADGKKTGIHTGWWENGQLQFMYHFSQDVFEGVVKEWYANGRLFREMRYINGNESGRQQVWQPDGSVFANYEARNGRNYGLTGTMHCKNYWDKVIVK